ncbi:hypothetical protein I4F81_004186 [Pyropia yezoensis]|uniref:Uncharacterized protein n=1 Tax=Pyropia yezoensis TaxID=2788 RepID=A0ACC3BVK3_PYRYE|nr:hypothetical protein I4F81_004186 [Neopyropia yezoensis]
MRDLSIKHGRHLFKMDETHVRARDLLQGARVSTVGPVGMDKPEVIAPSLGSGAPGCTVAFTVSPSGTVAPYFAVVEGSGPGHAFVTVADDGGSRQVALASRLKDGRVVVRRKPPGLDKAVFDLFAAMFAKWAKQFFPNEEKLLCLDGAKVHLSMAGLLALQDAKVTVITEPSKTSHVLQALDTPSLFGRFQPAVRRGIRTQGDACVMEGRRFNVLDLMDCVRAAALEAFTERTLASAFQRVGLWPPDPSRVSQEMLRKGADRPAPDVDLALLAARLVPVVRKDMAQPVVTNGTLSTAGTAVVLTAPQVIQALQDLEQDKLDKAEAKETAGCSCCSRLD